MAQFQKKAAAAETTPEEPKKVGTPKGAVDSKKFDAPLHAVRTLRDQLTSIEQGLEASAKETASIEEERRQEGATFTFNLKLEREKQLADFAKQDAERAATFSARENALTIAEGDFGELLGVDITPGDHLTTGKALRTALEAKFKEQFDAGEKKGKDAATASYNIAKQVDAANARTELELLKQKVATLEASNAKLETANKQLAEANQRLTDQNAEVAKTGLNAAAGVVAQGNSALSSAAGTIPGGSRTTR